MSWNEIAVVENFTTLSGSETGMRRVVCRICHEIVFDLPPGYTRSEMRSEVVRLRIHYGLWHDVSIDLGADDGS